MTERKIYVAAAFFIAYSFFAGSSEAKLVRECVYLVPAGNVDKKIVDKVKDALPSSMPVTIRVETEKRQELPPLAYDPSKKQYNARTIIDYISERIRLAVTNERVLAITDADLHIPGSDFVLGMADPKKGVAIISTERLKNEFYGLAPDRRSFNDRVLKEALYQLGRSWGIPDCPSPRCPMNVSGKMQDMDKKRDTFCYKCRIAIENRYADGGIIGEKIKKR
jgi:archaemetzincin